MIYVLRKTLYGLRQTPIGWYSRINSYFCIVKLKKCHYEHILFVKHGRKGKGRIASLYVDGLIYTSNNFQMMKAFKRSMKGKFPMTGLGKMKHFLGIKVKQGKSGIFIHQ